MFKSNSLFSNDGEKFEIEFFMPILFNNFLEVFLI
jgi:hypothetical protein